MGMEAFWGEGKTSTCHADTQADSAEDKEKKALVGTLGAYWYLDYLCVDTSLQSKGLGTRALAHCIRQAQVCTPALCCCLHACMHACACRSSTSKAGEQPTSGDPRPQSPAKQVHACIALHASVRSLGLIPMKGLATPLSYRQRCPRFRAGCARQAHAEHQGCDGRCLHAWPSVEVRGCAQDERDCPMLANTCSEAARSFYLRNGFQEVGVQPMLIGKRAHWWLAHPARGEQQDIAVK